MIRAPLPPYGHFSQKKLAANWPEVREVWAIYNTAIQYHPRGTIATQPPHRATESEYQNHG